MSTVDKKIADIIVAGNGFYPGDEHLPPVKRIIEYDNAWGGIAYGLERARDKGRFSPSEFVRNPRVYWSQP